jgi:DhnA family fructose-bisphosphate aldolase class Ia
MITAVVAMNAPRPTPIRAVGADQRVCPLRAAQGRPRRSLCFIAGDDRQTHRIGVQRMRSTEARRSAAGSATALKGISMTTAPIPHRLRGILKADGRCLTVAIDHGMVHGPARGLENTDELIERMIDAGADALMVSYGTLKRSGQRLRGRIPVIARIDGGPSVRTGVWREYDDWRLLFDVEDAAALGADAVVVMHFVGAPVEMDTLQNMAEAVAQCQRAGLPLLVEALACPHPNIPDIFDPATIALAARIAAEYGADFVKTTYSGDPESFRQVVRGAAVPVLVLGGERMNSDRAALELTHGAVAAGAAGIVMGRNIWQAPDPAAMVRALRAMIHDGASVDAAAALL